VYTHTTIAQAPPVEVQDGAIAIPLEALLALGLGGVLWLFKWLISREFSRLEGQLRSYGDRLESLEKADSRQAVDLAQIARLEADLQVAERQLAKVATDLATLPKIESSLERAIEAQGELREKVQRTENVGFALKQAQELVQQTQRDLLMLRTELAAGYVSEEKYVRDATVFSSRLDAVWERIDEALGGSRGNRLLEGRRES